MIDFPASPTVGQIFSAAGCSWRWSGTKWVANVGSGSGGGSTTTIGDLPPSTPALGSGWWDSTDGNLYLWYTDPSGPSQWVPATNLPGPVGPAGPPGVDGFGRSYIHNGLFNIQQRGLGPWTASLAYTADRWQQWFSGGSINTVINQHSDTARSQIGDEAAQYTLYTTFTGGAGASDGVTLSHLIEGVRRLAGKTVTVSFWAASNAGTPKLGISLDSIFGTGGSPSAVVVGVGQSVTISTTWSRYTLTFTLASASGKILGTNNNDRTSLNFWYSAGTSWATASGSVGVQSSGIALWGVQLEVGILATPLEKPDPRYDLANCQRFYQVLDNITIVSIVGAGSFNSSMTNISWPTRMRAVPTIVATHIGGSVSLGANTSGTTASMLLIYFAGSPTTGNYESFTVTASADL
jgi:hypothetical protein